jgi:quinol monooxygenase YgiN
LSTDQHSGTTDAGAPAGPLQVGDLLAERYRLAELVAAGEHAALWRAHDTVLARPVAVKVVGTPDKGAREAARGFLDAAIRTGAVNHPGLVRVYDASQESRPGRGNDVAYVISEWVDGESLDVHLNRLGALPAPDAVDVLRQAADALTAAHAAGVVHGRVHPRNVLVTGSGRVRLTDAEVGCAVHGWDPRTPATDTRDLAAVLYALTTARWPSGPTTQPADGLRAAPLNDGHPLSPRQLRAGLPRALDQVVIRGLDPQRPERSGRCAPRRRWPTRPTPPSWRPARRCARRPSRSRRRACAAGSPGS